MVDVLFNRAIEVTVENIAMQDMDLKFSIAKTRTKEPNTCQLTIFNLSPRRRAELAETSNPAVRFKAGYKPTKEMQQAAINAQITKSELTSRQNFSTLFIGEMDFLFSNYVPPKWVTTMSCGDGLSATMFSRVNKSFIAGTRYKDIIRKVAEETGLGDGNLMSKAMNLIDNRLGKAVNGYTASGNALKELERLSRSAGFEYSIQDGNLQFLDLGEALTGEAIVLSPATGLIGSPTISNETLGTRRKKKTKKSKNKINCTSLLNPRIIPGAQVVIKSKVFAQDKRIIVDSCEYVGGTRETNWYTHILGTAV